MTVFQPATIEELRDLVAEALAKALPMEICGGGSKRGLGRPVSAPTRVNLDRLSGIADYEPAELVLTAKAGTPMSEIEAVLAANRQMLAFEPPLWQALLAGERARPTLGGVLACNLAGPRRIKVGAARDHFLGVTGINGFGEIFKAGGKVVKNVTGYDLCKLMAGSYGTLALMAEVTVKVVPRPDESMSLLIVGLEDAAGVAALTDGLNAPHEVSAAAHLPPAVAARSRVASVAQDASVTILRLEGPHASIAFRARALHDLFAARGRIEELSQRDSEQVWREIAEVQPLLPLESRVIWRLSLPASGSASAMATIARQLDTTGFYDWGGGLIWLAVNDERVPDGGAPIIRAALAANGGHATLVRAPESLRASVPVFEPLPKPLAALTRRVKESFDPKHLFNPGRMYSDM